MNTRNISARLIPPVWPGNQTGLESRARRRTYQTNGRRTTTRSDPTGPILWNSIAGRLTTDGVIAVLLILTLLVLPMDDLTAQPQTVHGKPWYESARIFYDWIRIGEDLDEDYARHLVRKTIETNCNTLAFCVQVGGYALWDSEVTPRYDRIGDMDLIGELDRLCEKNNIYFVPWWLGTAPGVGRVLKEHPGWALKGPPQGDEPGRDWHYVCYNSPYRDLLYEEVREVLSRYDVDGIYFDQLPGSGYCEYCKAKFENMYHQPMPIVPEETVVPLLHKAPPAGFPTLLRQFRERSIIGFCEGIREVIDATQPDVVYVQNWINGDRARLGRGIVDVVLPEFYQSDDLIPLGLKHRMTKAYFGGGAIWGNIRHSVRHDARHFPVRGTRLLLMDAVANKAAPLMLDLGAMDFDPTGLDALKETFTDISEVFELTANAEEVSYAYLLHSLPTYENYLAEYNAAFEGLYRIMFEAHIPFDIINEQQVQEGILDQARVLVVANGVFLQEATLRVIERHVNQGMGLVATHMTGFRDSNGQIRSEPALADLLGYEFLDVIGNNTSAGLVTYNDMNIQDLDTPIFYYASARTNHPLASDLPPEGLFSFQGDFVMVRPKPGTEVFADIHPPDHSRIYAEEYNRRGVWPGEARWPLAIARTAGKGKVAYFTPQAEAEWRRMHSPELTTLFENTIKWGGGDLPISAPDVPPSVELRFFHNPDARQYIVLMVNQTTNSLSPPGQAHIGVIRYVIPHKEVQFTLNQNIKVKNVSSLKDADIDYQSRSGGVEITLSDLDLYEAVTIQY